MAFDDRWFDAKLALEEAAEHFPSWLPERERQAFRDAVAVAAYLSRFVDIAGMPETMRAPDEPITPAFAEIAAKLAPVAELIRTSGLLEWDASKEAKYRRSAPN